MPKKMTIRRLRAILQDALIFVDGLDRDRNRIDQRVVDLLSRVDDGLSTHAMKILLRVRHSSLYQTLKVMESRHVVSRADGRKWRLEDGQ